MAKVICVMEENKPASQLLLPVTDDYSISTGFLNKYFPNGLGLKFKTTHSDIYQAVAFDVEHEKFIIGEENFKLNYVYVVHRINNDTVQTTTTQTSDRFDTPPLRPCRHFIDYSKIDLQILKMFINVLNFP
ncbi:unnamed protein product [Rotaria sordida]|uniref:Uncharacterized protein n=2 Tax=Rotaria sordida TaxID=392033 RepID=A0A815F3Q5_9BILA|nr:unnamed protein product [Rotaria sordida]